MKKELLNKKTSSLNLNETLICLSISSSTNPFAEKAMKKLKDLQDCEMHITHLPKQGDEEGLRRLRINVTTDANLSLLAHFQ